MSATWRRVLISIGLLITLLSLGVLEIAADRAVRADHPSATVPNPGKDPADPWQGPVIPQGSPLNLELDPTAG